GRPRQGATAHAISRRGAAATGSQSPALAQAPRRHRQGGRHRAGTHPRGVSREGPANRAGGTGLSLARDELTNRMPTDPELRAHQEWLGYVQPVGLVVSAPALCAAAAHPNKNIVPDHRRFLECVREIKRADGQTVPAIGDFPAFAQQVFGWKAEDLVGGPGAAVQPETLEVTLPDYNETLRPTYALKEFEPKPGACPWIMLIQELPPATPLDDVAEDDKRHWQATPQARFERLLRETQVPAGLLVNATELRLVYAPRGESSGHMTFPVAHMAQVAGRPIF